VAVLRNQADGWEAEVLSGRRINEGGTVLPLEEDRFEKGWQRLVPAVGAR
jgi:hypothetical protein